MYDTKMFWPNIHKCPICGHPTMGFTDEYHNLWCASCGTKIGDYSTGIVIRPVKKEVTNVTT